MHFQNKTIAETEKTDRIIKKICSGGSNIMKGLEFLKDLTENLDIAIAKAIVQIVLFFFDITLWYSLLCSDLKNSHSN